MTDSIPAPLRERFASGMATNAEREEYLRLAKGMDDDAYREFRRTMTEDEQHQYLMRIEQDEDEFDRATLEFVSRPEVEQAERDLRLDEQPFILDQLDADEIWTQAIPMPRSPIGLGPCKCGQTGTFMAADEDFVTCPNCGRTRHRFSRRERFARRVRSRFRHT